MHCICLLCQQEPCHFGSLCLPEVSSESLPTFSDSSPLTRHNWASSHPREWCSQRQNCRSGTWTKVTCFNLGWQRAKGSRETVSTLTSPPLHSLRRFRIRARLGNVLRLDETDLGSVRNINGMEMLVFFYATAAWLIKPVQSKTGRCKITQGEPVYLSWVLSHFLYSS